MRKKSTNDTLPMSKNDDRAILSGPAASWRRAGLQLRRMLLLTACMAAIATFAWYTTSFVPHLAALHASAARGLAAAGGVARWDAALRNARETPSGIRSWAMRQSYATANPLHDGMLAWHANTLLWYGASYLHFDHEEVAGIWFDCAGEGCGNGLAAASQRYLGKPLRDVTPEEMTRLLAFARSPVRYPLTPS